MNDRALSVKDICQRFGVGEHTVLQWIRSGDLTAIDVSRNRGGKPKWRITPEALAAFELSRMYSPPPKPTRRNKNQSMDVIKFY